jgi:hypothetical protein
MNGSLNQEREMPAAPFIVIEPRLALVAVKHWIWVHRSELICVVLLAAAAVQMLAVVRRKNITVDEIVMIPSAYYHLVAGNFQLVSEHPPLSKFIAAAPLLLVQPNEPQPADWGRFWEANSEHFEAISLAARLAMIALTLGLGLLIFVIARQLFDARAALFAVALFSFEPTVLAHGRVVQTDIPAAFGYLLFFFALYRYLRKPSWQRATALAGATAVAILAKFSMLLTAPILVLVLIVLIWRAPAKNQQRSMFAKHALLVTEVVLILVNAAYFFHRRALTDADALWTQQSFPAHYLAVLRTVRLGSYVVPTDFLMGIFWQVWHNAEGHPAAILGRYGRMGWWYYFPVAFALKTTLPFLCLSVASLAWATYKIIRKRDLRFVAVLIPLVIYTGFVLFSHIDIGIRYYLPAFPFLFILGGAFLSSLLDIRRARIGAVAIVCLALGWHAFEGVRAYPNYIPYLNQLASSHPHWWYLSDSNVEWGDDAKELAAYLHQRGEGQVRTAFLGDFFTLNHYDIEAFSLISSEPGEPPHTRYVAIGASFLNGSTIPEYFLRGEWPSDEKRINFLAEYRGRVPEAVIGNSIYVYRMED